MFDRAELKKYLEDNGIKQKYVAKRAGMTEEKLSKILSGKRKCDVNEFLAICSALNKKPDDFVIRAD
ncbi:helix-turn-helix transcriptional regulator [uncultured Dubosiella sp.]|uniref:helix-turn-helix domain-containing protein n=1 Tax=uncultured Dubosiella sp. TaxID=1937011 RepID=UPI002731D24B|nr:helix-turn-helix transcriptional regulator [uncultured Dubosiella sp.]